jgi:hypothetical protein
MDQNHLCYHYTTGQQRRNVNATHPALQVNLRLCHRRNI